MDYNNKRIVRNFLTYYLVGSVLFFCAVTSSSRQNTPEEDTRLIPSLIELFSSEGEEGNPLEDINKKNVISPIEIIYPASAPSQ